MTYDVRRHQREFEMGARSHMLARVPKADSKLRERVFRFAVANLPPADEMQKMGRDAVVRHILSGRGFYRDVGGFWWILSWTLISSLVKAMVEYWFLSLEGNADDLLRS